MPRSQASRSYFVLDSAYDQNSFFPSYSFGLQNAPPSAEAEDSKYYDDDDDAYWDSDAAAAAARPVADAVRGAAKKKSPKPAQAKKTANPAPPKTTPAPAPKKSAAPPQGASSQGGAAPAATGTKTYL